MIHPSNFRFVLESNGEQDFYNAMKIVFEEGQEATHYRIDGDSLSLFWRGKDLEGVKELPYPMDYKSAPSFIIGWLNSGRPQARAPDTDGDVEPDGYRIESLNDDMWVPGIVKITKVWSVYHK